MNAKHDFSSRLNTALDLLPPADRPPVKGGGRQTYVAKMFGVSQKGARKWLEGEAIPSTSRMPEFEDKLHVSAAWLWTGSGTPELGARSQKTDPTAGTSYASPRVARVLAAITNAASAGHLTEADLEMLHSLVVRLQARAIGTSDLVGELALLTPEQTRLDDLYRQAGAFEPEQIMLLAKQLEAEAQRRSGKPQGTGKTHGREAGTG